MNTSTAIHIRLFTPEDAGFILSLVKRFSSFDLPAWRSASEIDNTNQNLLRQAMKDPKPDSAIFIAQDESGSRAGFIHLQTQVDYFTGEKRGYISDIAVDKSFEGMGVGRALMKQAEEWSTRQGHRLLTLYVFANNHRARSLYERYGFQQEVVKYAKIIEPKT